MPNSDSLQRVFPPAPVISNVALRWPRSSRLRTTAYKPILAFLISLWVSWFHYRSSLLSSTLVSLIPAYPRLHAIPLYFPCLYLYPVTTIQIMTAQRGRLEVNGVILSHLRIFATSHADLFFTILPSVAIFPPFQQTCPSNSIGRLARNPISSRAYTSRLKPTAPGPSKSEKDRYRNLICNAL